MLRTIDENLDRLLGLELDAPELGFSHMAWRALVVFAVAVCVARVADRRFLGGSAGFDVMFGVILGSVVSRGINGEAAFFPTLGVGFLLVVLHRVLGTVAYRWHWFSCLVKGRHRVLVRDGAADEREMARNRITRDDLEENLRLHGNVRGAADVAEARLERNGRISVVRLRDERALRDQ